MVEFNQINIWNYGLLARERIADDKLRKYVSELLAENRCDGKPIQDIAIISFLNKTLFSPLTKKEYNKIDKLRKVLFLASVSHSNIYVGPNAGLDMVTSDNFSVVYQNFQLDSSSTAYNVGRLVRIKSGGHKLGEIIYESPRFLLRNKYQIDRELFNALLILSKKKPRKFDLIVRATDAMMNGYSNSDDVSYEARILEQSRAFEILLQLPEKDQRKIFKEYAAKYCNAEQEKQYKYKSERANGKSTLEQGSKQVFWADRFYTLRNHIIHGESINDKSFIFFGQAHYHLALWFFLVMTKRIINESLKEPLFFDFIRNEAGKFKYDRGIKNLIICNAMLRQNK
jgi:hypothetical protein